MQITACEAYWGAPIAIGAGAVLRTYIYPTTLFLVVGVRPRPVAVEMLCICICMECFLMPDDVCNR